MNYKSDGIGILVDKSSIEVSFPFYLEKKIRESWDIIKRIIRSQNLSIFPNYSKGLIRIVTTHQLEDPYLFFKGRDFAKLISRGVPVNQAAKIFDQNVHCEIIKLTSNNIGKRNFLLRRRRLLGSKGETIMAIEKVTTCYLLIQGHTVACMGSHSALKQAGKIIQGTMENIHPLILIKQLTIKQKLSSSKSKEFIKWPSIQYKGSQETVKKPSYRSNKYLSAYNDSFSKANLTLEYREKLY
mmetsp:Transcript_48939/g.76362  ORF Transcript_48939/g.76362 Transcript_48939/m.76362 type:complete len:241 (-) Transcript_48939:1897-2619(-)